MAQEPPLRRKLAAIVAADVVGYSRMTEAAEVETLQALRSVHKQRIVPILERFRGRLVKTIGDGFLFDFASAVDAILFSLDFQKKVQADMASVRSDRRLVFRVGVHAGDVLSDGADVFGDGVNVAARLETLCTPGGICISAVVQQQLMGKLDLPLIDLGQHQVKNITRSIHVFGLDAAAIAEVEPIGPEAATPRPPRRRSAAAVLVAAAVLSIGLFFGARQVRPWIARHGTSTLSAGERDFSIAVLPFKTVGDEKAGPLADALVDNLTTDLGIGFPASSVIASSSTFAYRDKPIDPRLVGEELRVRYLLEGSVQRTGERLRVNVHLIDTGSGALLWSDHFEQQVTELASVQDEVTTGIANALSVQIVRAETSRSLLPANPTALDLVFRASALTLRVYADEDGKRAEALLRRALEIEPDNPVAANALAQVLLVQCTRDLLHQRDSFRGELGEAGKLLDGIRKKAPRLPGLNNNLAFQALLLDKPEEALDFYAQEIDADPSAAAAFAGKGLALVRLGRAQEAVPLILKSMRLDPRSPGISANYQALMIAYFALGDFKAAIAQGEHARDASPDSADVLFYLASAEALSGDQAAAKDALADAQKLDPTRRLSLLRKGVVVSEPAGLALAQKYIEGLRLAGLPE